MQTEEALARVYEQAEDLSKDGVVYFETRFAPIFHTKKGLAHQQSPRHVSEASVGGFTRVEPARLRGLESFQSLPDTGGPPHAPL